MTEVLDVSTGEVVVADSLVFSDSQDKILEVLFNAKKEIGTDALTKNARNDYHNSSYADINAVLERVEPVLMELGVLSLTSSAVSLAKNVVTVSTKLIHIESKEFVTRTMTFQPDKLSPQAVASCESYGRRYNHMGLFNLRSEDDDCNAGEGVSSKGKASRSKRGESKRGKGGSGGDAGGERKPTAKQVELVRQLAAERAIEVPAGALDSSANASKFISEAFKGDHGPKKAGAKPAPEKKGDVSQATQVALDYIANVSLERIGDCRERVKTHGQISAAEKPMVLKAIDDREDALKKAS